MALLNEQEQRQVAQAIAAVERTTDAELVTVLAARADDYRYAAPLWAALLALLVPGLVNFYALWLDARYLWLLQLACFAGVTLLLQLPALNRRLVPRRLRHWHAANLARRQFLEQRLHHTDGATGILIFVCEAERYVEILVDRGIARHLPDASWQAMVARFTQQVGQGQTLQGFLDCIAGCGELLAQHLPASHERNELPNHLVILD
ncbi:MAG: hypothetical protein ABWY06_21430 [Pseudomonas sp.]|uniref:TPM domain-containing protein n=1 Tax=Pseudomonas sp. TaxID=306 RepID=UPI003399BBC3